MCWGIASMACWVTPSKRRWRAGRRHRSAIAMRDAAPHPKRADHDEAVALGDRGEGADRVEGAVAPQEDALSGGVPRASRQRSLAVFLRRFSAVSRRGSHHARVKSTKKILKKTRTTEDTKRVQTPADACRKKKHKIRSAPGSPPHLQEVAAARDPRAPRTCAASRGRRAPRASATSTRSTPRAGQNVMTQN